MDGNNSECKSAQIVNKAIDIMDRLSYEMLFPRDLVKYGADGQLVQRELPKWVTAISDFEKRMVNSVLCPQDLVKAKADSKLALPEMTISDKKN